jgi:hypothetical protein
MASASLGAAEEIGDLISTLRNLCVLCVSAVYIFVFTAETQRTQRLRRDFKLGHYPEEGFSRGGATARRLKAPSHPHLPSRRRCVRNRFA